MADGQLFKPEKDFTKDVDKQLPEAEETAKVHPNSLNIDGLPLSFTERCSIRHRKALRFGETDQTSPRPNLHREELYLFAT